MDPKQTLKDMQELHRLGDHEAAAECARYLLDWLATGGFSPVPYSRATFTVYLRNMVRRSEVLTCMSVEGATT